MGQDCLRVSRFSKNPTAFLKYLDHYPYKFVLSPNDFQTGKQFQSLYNEAANEVPLSTPQSLGNAQGLLEELVKISKTVKSAHSRMETTKTLDYISFFNTVFTPASLSA